MRVAACANPTELESPARCAGSSGRSGDGCQAGFYSILCIVTEIIGELPAVRLYETQ